MIPTTNSSTVPKCTQVLPNLLHLYQSYPVVMKFLHSIRNPYLISMLLYRCITSTNASFPTRLFSGNSQLIPRIQNLPALSASRQQRIHSAVYLVVTHCRTMLLALMACWSFGRVFEVVHRVRDCGGCLFRYTGIAIK